MNKSILLGAVLGAVGVTAGGAMATYSWVSSPQYAEVVAVAPALETVKTPREVCEDVQVTRRRAVQDQHQIAGTVIGAVAGGLLGNQVGGGNGKKLATVAGAAAGGYAGNKVQEGMQARDTYVTTERRCKQVVDSEQRQVGFDVQVQHKGALRQLRLSYDPGKRIPLDKQGELLLVQPAQG